MDTRKVQITGGSTYMITLPKTWAEKIGLEPGTEVQMLPMPHRVMLLKPKIGDQDGHRVGEFQLGDQDGEPLSRNIISYYIAGYEIVKIRGEQISSSQRSIIRSTTQSLIGPEIVEESSNLVVIRNLSDLSELSIKETLYRIHQIARSMFEEAVRSLITHDEELARDVGDRDDDVDRLYLAISRRFRVMLYDIIIEDAEEVSRVEYYDYQTAAKQLERIADHAKKIAETVTELESKIPEELGRSLQQATEDAVALMDQALDSLHQRDIELANQSLARGPQIESTLLELNRSLRELNPQSSQLIGIVVDSIDRVKEYGINIAETALNSSCPLPGENSVDFHD
ncbi:MAG: PhoU domain-containing protein [Candidatus Bipolaricaulota bacterium]